MTTASATPRSWPSWPMSELREEAAAGAEAVVVLDQTPFYAEMGGQVADHGTITADGVVFTVADVQKNKGGKFMHYGRAGTGCAPRGRHRSRRH